MQLFQLILLQLLTYSIQDCSPEIIHTFQTEEGLADVFVCYSTYHTILELTVVGNKNSRIDTLYEIKGPSFIGPNGIETRVDTSNFHGYLVRLKRPKELILVLSDENGNGVSDNLVVIWNKNRKKFELVKSR